MPGYILSEDFVMRDETGIIFLDYRQPLAIWEMLFGLLKAGDFAGEPVVVEGWYRRANKHKFVLALSYTTQIIGDNDTTFALLGIRKSGEPHSITFGGR